MTTALGKLFPYFKTWKPKLCKEVMGKIKGLKWPSEFSIEIAEALKFKDALPLAEAFRNRLLKY